MLESFIVSLDNTKQLVTLQLLLAHKGYDGGWAGKNKGYFAWDFHTDSYGNAYKTVYVLGAEFKNFDFIPGHTDAKSFDEFLTWCGTGKWPEKQPRWITPTMDHVGMDVQVSDSAGETWLARKLLYTGYLSRGRFVVIDAFGSVGSWSKARIRTP